MQSRKTGVGVMLTLLALCLTAIAPSSALANYFLGGWNNYQNRGVYATIRTSNPAITQGFMSAAYVMTCTNGTSGSEYIQAGWTKENSMSVPAYFWEWSSEFTGMGNHHQWGSPPVGSKHQYQISADSSWWNFYLDGSYLTKMSLASIRYWPGQIQFFGEKERYTDKWAGTAISPCTFEGGFYKNSSGSWYGTYYFGRNSGGGVSTASNRSNSFSIWND